MSHDLNGSTWTSGVVSKISWGSSSAYSAEQFSPTDDLVTPLSPISLVSLLVPLPVSLSSANTLSQCGRFTLDRHKAPKEPSKQKLIAEATVVAKCSCFV